MRIEVQRLTEASKDDPQRRTAVNVTGIARVLDGQNALKPTRMYQTADSCRRQRLVRKQPRRLVIALYCTQ